MMNDSTILTDSPVGKHIDAISDQNAISYLLVDKKKIQLVAKITIGRESDNTVVIDNKLASRHHALIQKIREDYFLKDEESTNGTYLNGTKIPAGKYVKLNHGDKITIGSTNLVFS
ncbi:FHA domain-containing protein [Treponema sp.]|uniref:FHA domain-containing protein n=1 Tax=Treponema sp. TaxID=166 RepID=UPI00298E7165|nr:FHA domain-containing protein [Treponema sp.]